MVDIHSHILPGIDDGSESVEMSIQMLRDSMAQGVDTVISTSHCYLREESDIDAFLGKRQKSYDILTQAVQKEKNPLPKIRLGAEVRIENDVSRFKNLEKLCIEGTNYILIEMSYSKWHQSVYDALYSMTLKNMRPVMAHIERFFANEKEFENLRDIDLAYQINADSFLNPADRKAVAYLLRRGMANVIGSDMHNTTVRVQRLKAAYEKIEKDFGSECARYFEQNSYSIPNNEDLEYSGFKKLGFFEKRRK